MWVTVKRASGIDQGHFCRQRRENDLEWTVDRGAADILEGYRAFESLIQLTERETRCGRPNLARWHENSGIRYDQLRGKPSGDQVTSRQSACITRGIG